MIMRLDIKLPSVIVVLKVNEPSARFSLAVVGDSSVFIITVNGSRLPLNSHSIVGVGAPVELQEMVNGRPSRTDTTDAVLAVVLASTMYIKINVINQYCVTPRAYKLQGEEGM